MSAPNRIRPGLPAWLAVLLLALPALQHAAEPAARLDFVGKLLFESSAAHRVVESADPEALRLHAEAEKRFTEAAGLLATGDDDLGQARLDEALKLMQAAVRASRADVSASDKARADFARRRQSLDALLEAHERITREKRVEERHAALVRDIEPRVAEATELLAAGDAAAGRSALDGAYDDVKQAIDALRSGDTLIRELDFATPADEFAYEIDRNDTHRMLITVLLDEKRVSGQRAAMTRQFVTRAGEIREQAEAEAAAGRYGAAIELLEASTHEYVRAIRSAGVYIPG